MHVIAFDGDRALQTRCSGMLVGAEPYTDGSGLVSVPHRGWLRVGQLHAGVLRAESPQPRIRPQVLA